MNEKYLWELWEKSKHPHPKYNGQDMVWPLEFAELIIQECVRACIQENPDPRDSIELQCANRILKRFGIE